MVISTVPSVLKSVAKAVNLQMNVSKTENECGTHKHTSFTGYIDWQVDCLSQVLVDRVLMEPSMTKISRSVKTGVPSKIHSDLKISMCHCDHGLLLLTDLLTD